MENQFYNGLKIENSAPNEADVLPLLELLSENLEQRFGSSGKDSFVDWDFDDPRYVFLKAVFAGETVGCGAIRPISDKIGEIKRMFAKHPQRGIGELVLRTLEDHAAKLGYEQIWLETRAANVQACEFYRKMGYSKIENFGKYVGRHEAICFGKTLKQNTSRCRWNTLVIGIEQVIFTKWNVWWIEGALSGLWSGEFVDFFQTFYGQNSPINPKMIY